MRAVYFLVAFLACAIAAFFLARGLVNSSDVAGEDAGEAGVFRSGPKVGKDVPGPFEPLNINGKDAGQEACLYCRYGNLPVAMVFVNQVNEATLGLIRQLEKAASASGKGESAVGACVIVSNTSPETQTKLSQFAEAEHLKYVVVGTIDPKGLKHYRLNPDAQVTMLLYRKHVVDTNRAIKNGDLNEKVVVDLARETQNFFAAN